MHLSKQHNDLLYKYEILRAKLEIRDHYFNSIVRDIYENTGQALSVVRVQLGVIGTKASDDIKAVVTESGSIIGQAIFDLREMTKNFFPEKEILSESGLVNALKRELRIEQQEPANTQIKVRGIPFALTSDAGMVFFFVVLEIVYCITDLYGVNSINMEVIYSETRLNLIISYSGKPIDLSSGNVTKFSTKTQLGILDRILLIGGNLIINNDNNEKATIDVSIPYDETRAA